MKKYYVYVYLDPTIKGNFIYGDYKFNHQPFYIGKGNGDRMLFHLHKVMNKHKYKPSIKFNRIESILLKNNMPIIEKIKDDMTEDDALNLENRLIKLIGRVDLNEGVLLNLNDGGIKPQDNYHHSDITKKKISKSSKKRVSKFYKLISPDGIIYENISLRIFCNKYNLNYDKMRKNSNRGIINNIRYTKNIKKSTENCIGWEVINSDIRRKEIVDDIKYTLISPKGEIYNIYTYQNASQIIFNLNLNFRTLSIYRNRGKIKIRNINQCTNEFSVNCEGWEFSTPNLDIRTQEFTSVRKLQWKITSPLGEVIFSPNLYKFCEENNLSYRIFRTFKNKGKIKLYKSTTNEKLINSINWSCEKI